MKCDSIAVLTSGGLDSAVLLSWACARFKRVFPIYIRCGLLWETAEIHWLRKYLGSIRLENLQKLYILTLPVQDIYQGHWALTGRRVPGYHSKDGEVYLPGRNLMLLNKVFTFCAIQRIAHVALGVLKANPFPDAQGSFLKKYASMASRALDSSIRIHTPFACFEKKDVVKYAGPLPLELTFSCLRPRGMKSCQRCNKCAERKKIALLLKQ